MGSRCRRLSGLHTRSGGSKGGSEMDTSRLLFETDTPYSHYEVWDTVYGGRPARVLYSGRRHTAQSGVPRDGRPELLFDYNQRLLDLVSAVQPRRLLLIGGGAYTLPMALLDSVPGIRIDVAEIDGNLETIAKRFFGLRSDRRLRLFHEGGRQHLDHNKQAYDMIIVDAFIQADAPDDLTTLEAAEVYKRNLTAQGLLARNVISAYDGPGGAVLRRQLHDWNEVFEWADIFPASPSLSFKFAQNLLLIAADKRLPGGYMRYPALKSR